MDWYIKNLKLNHSQDNQINPYEYKLGHYKSFKISSTNLVKAKYLFGIFKNLKMHLNEIVFRTIHLHARAKMIRCPRHFHPTLIIMKLTFMESFPMFFNLPQYEILASCVVRTLELHLESSCQWLFDTEPLCIFTCDSSYPLD